MARRNESREIPRAEAYFKTNGYSPPLLQRSTACWVDWTAHIVRVLNALAALLMIGGLGIPAAVADPAIPSAPACDPMDCLNNPAPPNGGEQNYLNLTRVYGGSDTQRLQIGRAACAMLAGGTNPGNVVRDIAGHLGTSNQNADQVMDEAMEDICPGLHLVPSAPPTVFVPQPAQPTPLIPGETICNPLGRWDPECDIAR